MFRKLIVVSLIMICIVLPIFAAQAGSGGTRDILEAMKKGRAPYVAYWIGQGADVETRDEQGFTPLAWAVSKGSSQLVSILLERGANLEHRNEAGETPLMIALRDKNIRIAKQLLERGANVEVRDRNGNTPLFLTLSDPADDFLYDPSTDVELLILVLSKGADIEARNAAGQTAAMVAAGKGRLDIVKLLQHEEEARRLRLLFMSYSSSGLLTPTEIHYAMFFEQIEEQFGEKGAYGTQGTALLDDPVVKACMAAERVAYGQGKYVFYRAEPGKYRVYEFFLEELDAVVRSFGKKIGSIVFTRLLKDAAQEMTINEYVETKPWSRPSDVFKNAVLSANIPLFGNVGNSGECTWRYFLTNSEIVGVPIYNLYERVFSLYGFDGKFIDDLVQLHQGELENMASLQQIIIPKNIVDDVAMLSGFGYCVPWPDMVDPSCWDPNAISAVGSGSSQDKLGRHTCISSIIDKYRTGAIKIDDNMQARILMNAAYGLNPQSGIVYNQYTRLPDGDTRIEQLRKQVRALTDIIFGEWIADQLTQGIRSPMLTSEEFRAVLRNYGRGDVERQTRFFDAFKKRQQIRAEERKEGAAEQDEEEFYKARVQEKGRAVSRMAARVAEEEIVSGDRGRIIKTKFAKEPSGTAELSQDLERQASRTQEEENMVADVQEAQEGAAMAEVGVQ